MILICYDCEGQYPGEAKLWRYPCDECALPFLKSHRAMGHAMEMRQEAYADKYLFSTY